MKRKDKAKHGSKQRRSRKQRSREFDAADPLPVRVPFSARLQARKRKQPVGETPAIDGWAQRAVWTDRMLRTLLTNTVRGGRWHGSTAS